jgi:hypothetical protein
MFAGLAALGDAEERRLRSPFTYTGQITAPLLVV